MKIRLSFVARSLRTVIGSSMWLKFEIVDRANRTYNGQVCATTAKLFIHYSMPCLVSRALLRWSRRRRESETFPKNCEFFVVTVHVALMLIFRFSNAITLHRESTSK